MKGWQWLILIAIIALATGAGVVATDVTTGQTVSMAVIQALADAIAIAEGFYVQNSVPDRQNNPGNLTANGAIRTFPTVQDGWNALYAQIQAMFNGTSQYYNPGMTLSQIGMIYARDANWGNNVAAILGVTPDTTLSQIATNIGG